MSNSSDANFQRSSKTSHVNLESAANTSNTELSRENPLDPTNRTSFPSCNGSYSPYGSGYGGYSSSYGGYGGYGGLNGYSGYGSTYGSYGYGSYGSPNQYSNTYSKPIPPNGNEQVPPPTIRNDVWGFLNGFHAILHVLYAATGIVHFGKMFLKMSIKIIKNIFGKSAGLFFRLTGFAFLKKIMLRFSSDMNWQNEFSFQDAPLENIWGSQSDGNINRSFFGKFRLVLQICSLMGALISYFLRRKIRNHTPSVHVDASVINSGEIAQEFKIKHVELADIEKFYEGIRGIQKDSKIPAYYPTADFIEEEYQKEAEEEDQIEAGLQDFNSFVQGNNEKSMRSKEDVESSSDVNFDLLESQLFMKEQEEGSGINEEIKEKKELISSEKVKNEVVQLMPTQFIQQVSTIENRDILENKEKTHEAVLQKKQIFSEDFWGNNSPKNIEETSNKISEPVQEAKKAFELPSVLQMLRANSASSNKPWLLKKKVSSVETKPEEVVSNSLQNNVESVEDNSKSSEVATETVQVNSNTDKTLESTA